MANLNPNHPLARALDARRDHFNRAFVSAKMRHRGLDSASFSGFLIERVAPIMASLAEYEEDAPERALDALYASALELVARGIAGESSRYPAVDALFSDVLPRLGRFVMEDPAHVVRAFTHAVINLENIAAVDTQRWLRSVVMLAPRARDARALLDAGKVLAWQLGASHWRESALEVLASLPEDLVLPALRLPDSDRRSRSELVAALQSPWADLHSAPNPGFEMRGWLGGFTGFGGEFSSPPRVMAIQGTIYAFDDSACYALFADAYGSTLVYFGNELPDVDAEDVPADPITIKSGVARRGSASARILGARHITSTAQSGDTLAITVAHSHAIMLVTHVRG